MVLCYFTFIYKVNIKHTNIHITNMEHIDFFYANKSQFICRISIRIHNAGYRTMEKKYIKLDSNKAERVFKIQETVLTTRRTCWVDVDRNIASVA